MVRSRLSEWGENNFIGAGREFEEAEARVLSLRTMTVHLAHVAEEALASDGYFSATWDYIQRDLLACLT